MMYFSYKFPPYVSHYFVVSTLFHIMFIPYRGIDLKLYEFEECLFFRSCVMLQAFASAEMDCCDPAQFEYIMNSRVTF